MAESKLQPVQEVDFPARATAIRDQLTQLTRERRAELREFSRSLVTRIEKTLDYLLVISAAVDPHLVTERMVRAVTEELDDLNGGLENFADGGGVPYLQRIDIATDGVLDALGIWVGLINEPTYDAIRKAASAYRRSLGQQLINVRGDLRSLQQSFAAFQKTQSEARREFENELASERERIEELISSVQQQTTQLSEAITAQASRAEQVSATFQEQFAEAQERRSVEFQKAITEAESSTVSLRKALEERTNELVDEIEQERDRARDLVGVIAATGTASIYGEEAKLQKKVADTLRWVAILIGLAASGLAVWTVLAAADTTSVARLVGKVVAAIALYGVAGYVASQSAAHRRREEHAKRRELDLVAFGPFIADLEEPDRQLARKELVAKLFGNDALDDEKKGGVLTQENVGLLGQLWEIFSKSRK